VEQVVQIQAQEALVVEQVLEIMRVEKVAVVAGTAAAGRVVQM
jgi:hypothetical protein